MMIAKRKVRAALLISLIFTLAFVCAHCEDSDFKEELLRKYSKPDFAYGTELRWWMAEGSHTDQTLSEDLEQMAAEGFSGVELCQLNEPALDETAYGYGSAQWAHDVSFVMKKALGLGMKVSLTAGTNWACANVPGLDPDSQAALQEMGNAYVSVSAGETYAGELPVSAKSADKPKNLFAVMAYAYEMEEYDQNDKKAASRATWLLYEDSCKILTDQVEEKDGSWLINWTAPKDGPAAQYVLLAFYQEGAYQQSVPSTEPAYCINYFDQAGVEALKDYWIENFLADQELVSLIRTGDVQMFMDSLEISPSEREFFLWSEGMAQYFKERKGYEITPYLPLIIGMPSLTTFDPAPADHGKFDFISDKDIRTKVLNDFFDVQTRLYIDQLMNPLKHWLNDSYGMKLRAQISYGRYIEISEPIAAVDYPEAETLNQRDQVDIYRLWSGGAHLQNKVLSSETGAVFGNAYGMTVQQLMKQAYILYSAGFNRIIWHVYTSVYGPEGSVDWPGYEGGIKNLVKISPREPAFEMMDQVNEHLGRIQRLLREGKPSIDVGLLYARWNQPIPFSGKGDWMETHEGMIFPSTALQDNGYTYDYVSPTMLTADGVYFDGETKTLEMSGYQAVVVWQEWLDADAAKVLLTYAEQGLPVVVIDGAASITPFLDGREQKLAQTMVSLGMLKNARVVESAKDVVEALRELDVIPYASFPENHQLLSQMRRDGDVRYLYLYNYCSDMYCGEEHGTNIQTDISLDGIFQPYAIDAWTGEVRKVSVYHHEKGRTILPVSLDYHDVALYAFEPVKESGLSVLSSDAEEIRLVADQMNALVTASGTYTVELSDGRVFSFHEEVPESKELTNWKVKVESWEKGDWISRDESLELMDGLTTVEGTFATEKKTIELTLNELTTWDKIPEVGKDISGRAVYTAAFEWDGAADGAFIDFGFYDQLMKVKINGLEMKAVNANRPVLDISEFLVEGMNVIELSYASTLTNVQLSRGIIKEAEAIRGWQGYDIFYHSYGPSEATLISYKLQEIE